MQGRAGIGRELLAAVLTRDWLFRRDGRWPLLHYDELLRPYGQPELSNLRLPRLWSSTTAPPEAFTVEAQVRRPARLPPLGDVHRTLREWFPMLDTLLALGDGHLIAAGGAVVSAIRKDAEAGRGNQKECGDCDFFFVGLSVDAANKLLDLLLASFCSASGDCVVMHSKHAVTVRQVIDQPEGVARGNRGNRFQSSRRHSGKCARLYQFIKRIYPRSDVVIGGFDLPASSVFLDEGGMIWTTPLGAFTLATNALIVDPSRRSPTMELR
jgi:hypothetical protein